MKRRIILASLVVVALAAAGTAYGVVSRTAAATQTITACVNEDGQLRLAPVSGTCKKNEQLLTWNTVGPAGAAGLQGLTGLQGVAGPQGVAGRDGRDATSSSPDAATATISVTGQRSGSIADGVAVTSVSHEISSARDVSSGLPTGKRQHKPITITMDWGPSTALLISALASNENLTSVEIDLQGGPAIKLTNANVSDYQQHGGSATFSFTYQKIEWKIGTTEVLDSWEAVTG